MLTERTVLSDTSSWETVPSTELAEVPRHRLVEFRRDLAFACESGFRVIDPVVSMPDEPGVKPINDLMLRSLDRQVRAAGRHVYLSPDYAWLADNQVESFSVLRTAGAETSAHGVFFGLITNDKGGHVIPVAVKPCQEHLATAYIDWLNNSMIAQTGRRHYKPIGFMIGEKTNYSLTELQEGAETLDSTSWRSVLVDETNTDYAGQRAALKDIGTTLGHLHAQNIFHGDPQLKNIALDVAGRMFFVDWESSSFYAQGVSTEVQTKKAAHDLKVLFRSLACSEKDMGVGLLDKFGPWMQWQHFKEYVFDSYMESYLGEDPDEAAFAQVAQAEADIHDYILQNGLAISFSRHRRRTAA